MNTPRRFPIFFEDQNVFDSLSKKIGSHAAAAADLPDGFPPLFRHADEFLAKSFGSTSRQRLFAEVKSTPPRVQPELTRQVVALQCEAAIRHGAAALVEDGLLTSEQASAIAKATPDIVRALSKDLQYLAIDRFTFERTVLDLRLLAARAPKFEYAITSDSRAVFDFGMAREALRAAAGEDSHEAISKIRDDDVQKILRGSVLPLLEAVKQRKLPVTHVPIVLCDAAGDVVGVSFQHPVHLGVVAVCCEDEERFWAVVAALHTGQPAQTTQGSNWALNQVRGFLIQPYSPPDRGFNAKEDDKGASVYFAPVSVERALEYLASLAMAVNGKRVPCTESNRQLLKSASLSSQDIFSGVGEKSVKRTYWLLSSAQSQPGQSKVMSASGTFGGIMQGGRYMPQWYLRQIYWLAESDFPEVGMPSDHFLAPRQNDDLTKIVPESLEDFTRRTLERLNKMPKDQKADTAIQTAIAKLQHQKKLLQKVKVGLEAEAQARIDAFDAGLCAVGPEVLPPA